MKEVENKVRDIGTRHFNDSYNINNNSFSNAGRVLSKNIQ